MIKLMNRFLNSYSAESERHYNIVADIPYRQCFAQLQWKGCLRQFMNFLLHVHSCVNYLMSEERRKGYCPYQQSSCSPYRCYSNLFQRKENDYYDGIINHLYNFADEVNKMESESRLSHNKANLLRP